MFNIYLQHFMQEGILIEGEALVFQIPMTTTDEPWILNPVFKGEMGKAETFDFTMNPGTKYYNALFELKTIVRVAYDGDTIFFGRVLTINTSSLLQIQSVHCEGIMAVLGDTPQEGIPEAQQVKRDAKSYLKSIIADHNEWIKDEPWKKITYGTVNVDTTNDSMSHDSTSWSTTLQQMNHLVDNYGGYMRIRYYKPYSNSAEYHFLDWYKTCFRDLGDGRPHIKIAKNLLDLSISSDSGEIFTRLIPVGETTTDSSSSSSSTKTSHTVYLDEKKYLTIDDLLEAYSQEELESDGFHLISDYQNAEERFGIIYRTESFPNARSSGELKKYALDWMKRNFFGALQSYNVKAIDMHMVGTRNEPKILVGDAVLITYPVFDKDGNRVLEQTRKLVCKSAQYNLFNPEQNTYVFGVPNDAIDFEYGTKRQNKKKSASAVAAQGNHVAMSGDPKESSKISFEMIATFILYYYTTRKSTKTGNFTTKKNNYSDGTYSLFMRKSPTYNVGNLDDFHTPLFAHVDPNQLEPALGKLPAISFRSNGIYNGESGNTATGTTPYLFFKDSNATYRPSGVDGGVFKDRVIGHYTYTNYEFGVGTRDDKYAFTFMWDRRNSMGSTETSGIDVIFYFPADQITAARSSITGGSNTDDEEKIDSSKFVLYTDQYGNQSYRYTDPDGKTAEDASREDGHADSGYMSDGSWYIRLNQPMTITLPNGDKQVLTGVVSEHDFHAENVPNFNVSIAVMENAITKYATVGYLRAFAADLGHDVISNQYQTDENGNVIRDENGEPIINAGAGSDAQWLADNFEQYEYEYETDANGNILKDSNGNPIVKKDSSGRPIYKRDANGNKIQRTDQYGNPLYQLRTGTKFQTTASQLAAVAGNFYYDSNGDVCIRSGAGFKIVTDEASFGLWHEGNLDAGMFTQRDANGKTHTHIKGNNIYVGDGETDMITLADVLMIKDQYDVQIRRGTWIQGDLTVTTNPKDSSKGGNILAKSVTISNSPDTNCTLTFTNRNQSVSINKDDVENITGTIARVKITGPINNKFTLWYLPVTKFDTVYGRPSSSSHGDWVECGTFSRAVSLNGQWSGDATSSAFPFYINVHPYLEDGTVDDTTIIDTFTIRTDYSYSSSKTEVLGLATVDPSTDDVSSYSSYSTDIYAPIAITRKKPQSSATENVYSKSLRVRAWPVWNVAANRSYIRGSGNYIYYCYPKEIEDPSSSTSPVFITGTMYLSTRNTDDYVYLGRNENVNGETKWVSYASLYHGQWTAGYNWGKSVGWDECYEYYFG